MRHHLPRNSSSRIKLCLFGASPDTANLGVSALFYSILYAIAEHYPNAALTVFDYGRGVRQDEILFKQKLFRFTRCGANFSRRYYRRDSLLNMRISATLGGLANPGVRAIAEADAVLDISGGDSFSDLYGNKRFQGITQPKRLALRLGTPLVLLPQTYGPFEQPRALQVTREIVCAGSMAWARDKRNFETLRELLREHYDPERHCEGVDVAFALPQINPESLSPRLASWIADNRTFPVVGFNISGLIYNKGAKGSWQFGFKVDYRDMVHKVLRQFLTESEARILLIPHVLSRPGHLEADTPACLQVAELLGAEDRIAVLDHRYDAMEIKWVIAQLDFFCGTRMHSTIAGLSSGVPTTAIAYSKKTLGVFESCGQGECVIDPRSADSEECIQRIWRIWQTRSKVAASLHLNLPKVLERAAEQIVRIFDHIEAIRASSQDPTPSR